MSKSQQPPNLVPLATNLPRLIMTLGAASLAFGIAPPLRFVARCRSASRTSCAHLALRATTPHR
jgi:hypothetical protein